MKYEAIEELSRDKVEAAIVRNDPQELLYAVLSAALYADDPDWAESVCLRLAEHEHFNVRGNAILGFAHIARIHGRLDRNLVTTVIEGALSDENDYVRGHAHDAADDIEFLLRFKFHRPR
jgi:hypothetical protein